MAKKARKSERKQASPVIDPKIHRELFSILILLVAVVSGLSLFNSAGIAGGYVNSGLSAVFGIDKYIFPILMLLLAAKMLWPDWIRPGARVSLGITLFVLTEAAIVNTIVCKTGDALLFVDTVSHAGGFMGLVLGYPILTVLGFTASLVVLGALLVVSIIITLNISVREVLGGIQLPELVEDDEEFEEDQQESAHPAAAVEFTSQEIPPPSGDADEFDEPAPLQEIVVKKKRYAPISIPTDILESRNAKPTSGDIHGRMMVIKKTLDNFGIPVEMGEVSVGPTVTQFTLKPAEGIKLTRITSLANDLALSLAAHPLRIEAPIPGKSLVGIEVPNQVVAMVGLREILESKEFKGRSSNLTISLGKDVSGKPWVADLAKMPHMLVAGSTGSGKTVCLNAIILSLIYQNNPDELKLLLIDPKRVELPVYNGIPHLLTPAITEVPKIINALKWAIKEMERRFDVLSKAGRRDIGSYNEHAEERMPYIVVIIDELADLMLASATEVEASIIRLAQLARAVGIHLIVATQRPSVDVITGLIKANITARIAFSVASSTDSRTILDCPGADKLVGRGDSLFLTAELSKPKRIQCCYVSENDIRKVVDYVKSQLDEPVVYEDDVTEKKSSMANGVMGEDDDNDDLFEEARDVVVRAGKASASYLQRRLRVGYARAARLLDLLEEKGIIGPGDGAKPRQVLVNPIEDVDGRHYSDSSDDEDGE